MDDDLTTWQRLLRILRIHGPLTVTELGRYLGIGSTAVRLHLERLQAEGWVKAAGLRRGSGRPGRTYSLTSRADEQFPHSYDRLAMELMDALSHLPDDGLLPRVVALRRKRWTADSASEMVGKELPGRLAVVADRLDQYGHLVEVQSERDGAFLLTEHHCGVGRVAERYPILCEEERAWLQDVLKARVERLQSRADGDRSCVFRVIPQPECPSGQAERSRG